MEKQLGLVEMQAKRIVLRRHQRRVIRMEHIDVHGEGDGFLARETIGQNSHEQDGTEIQVQVKGRAVQRDDVRSRRGDMYRTIGARAIVLFVIHSQVTKWQIDILDIEMDVRLIARRSIRPEVDVKERREFDFHET